jgi:hypothetical protein
MTSFLWKKLKERLDTLSPDRDLHQGLHNAEAL